MADRPDRKSSDPESETARAPGPAQVGAELRAVREQLGWSITELSVRLKIRTAQLEAIEAGDLAALPAPAYATGFIRAYADMIGLDPDEILRRFRAAGMAPPKQPKLAFPRPVPDRAVPPGAIVLLALLVALAAYLLWYRHTEHQRHLAQAIPPVPAKLAPLAIPKSHIFAPAPAPAPITTPTTPTPTSAAPVPPTTPPSATPAPTPPAPPATPSIFHAIGAAPAPTPNTTTPTTPAPAPTPPGPLAVAATAPAWVEIRDATGKILFTRILKKDEFWPVPSEPGLTLSTGNAGGTILLHNGQPSAPLGTTGVVLRHIELTPPSPNSAATPATTPPNNSVPK
ncbi:cytoskeleton protein RodZ [Acidiphilium sp. MT5]